jgi:hypothetical protein
MTSMIAQSSTPRRKPAIWITSLVAQGSTHEENMLSMFPRLRAAWFAIIAVTGYSGQAISQPSAHVTNEIAITGSDPVVSYVKNPNSVVFQLRTGVLRRPEKQALTIPGHRQVSPISTYRLRTT